MNLVLALRQLRTAVTAHARHTRTVMSRVPHPQVPVTCRADRYRRASSLDPSGRGRGYPLWTPRARFPLDPRRRLADPSHALGEPSRVSVGATLRTHRATSAFGVPRHPALPHCPHRSTAKVVHRCSLSAHVTPKTNRKKRVQVPSTSGAHPRPSDACWRERNSSMSAECTAGGYDVNPPRHFTSIEQHRRVLHHAWKYLVLNRSLSNPFNVQPIFEDFRLMGDRLEGSLNDPVAPT